MDYRTLFVVSDLHLGGYTGVFRSESKDWEPLAPGESASEDAVRSFRIFRDGPALAWAIGEAERADGPVALVLNGDIVDFLAVPNAKDFDPEGARANLERIVDDPEQKVVWEALRAFVGSGKGDLVLVLGNHDVELAMHDANAFLVNYLSEGKPERAERIVHCYSASGFSCNVGSARCLAVHGNDVDPWNRIDYQRLAEYADARRRASRLPTFEVNAGSALVVQHMNPVKRRFQWIDLLKPEQHGAALVSAAIDKEHAFPIGLMFKNFFGRGSEMRSALFVGDGEESGSVPKTTAPRERAPASAAETDDIDAIMRDAQEKDARGLKSTDLLDSRSREETLSAKEVLPGLVKLKLGRTLREVLQEYLPNDRSYDPKAPDETFFALDRNTSPEIEFLVAGHTHLERSIERIRGAGHYFNSGTWIKLVSIPIEALESDAAFAPIEHALREGSLEILDRPFDLPNGSNRKLIKTIRTVVRIEALDANLTRGSLLHVDGQPGSFSFSTVPRTERTIRRTGR